MSGNTFQQQSGTVQLQQRPPVTDLRYVGMRECVVAYLKTFIIDPLYNGDIVCSIDTYHKEYRGYMFLVEYVQYTWCIVRIRPVIKRKHHLVRLLAIFLNNKNRWHAFVHLICYQIFGCVFDYVDASRFRRCQHIQYFTLSYIIHIIAHFHIVQQTIIKRIHSVVVQWLVVERP